jgi:hypothetical protein
VAAVFAPPTEEACVLFPAQAESCHLLLQYAEKNIFTTGIMSKDASFFTHYYSHNVYSEKQI